MIFKNIFNLKDQQVKVIKNLIALGLFGIILILASSIISDILSPNGHKSLDEVQRHEMTSSQTKNEQGYTGDIKARLENILGEVEGAGKVWVEVFFESGPEYKYAYNENVDKTELQEDDGVGGIRKVSELSTSQELVTDGNQRPVMVKEIQPQVRGVLVVAQGAKNTTIRLKLINAIQAILGIPAHKIEVLPGQ